MPESPAEKDTASPVLRGLRLDLLVAVCALLISSLASAASWWQARLLSEQTHVLQEQLGAQVWPYVGVSENIDNAIVRVRVENDGLGPAVIRSETVSVDGKPKSSMVDVLHAVLGPNLTGRVQRNEKMSLGISAVGPGGVLRPVDSTDILTFGSKRFAGSFERAYDRLRFRVCYCAIVPGQCWMSDSASSRDPQPLPVCAEIANDLLHSSPIDALTRKF